jgi:hypothetical protein
MIQRYTRAEFEASLPKHKLTGEPLSTPLGLISREFCYLLPIAETGAGILIRSSVGQDGVCAETGEDSIRAYLVRTSDLSPLGPKLQRWVTRVPGWDRRLQNILRDLYKLGLHVQPCKRCGIMRGIVKIKKGKNSGRFALACRACPESFELIPASATMSIRSSTANAGAGDSSPATLQG